MLRVALIAFDRGGHVLQCQAVAVESVQVLNEIVEHHRSTDVATIIAVKSCNEGADVWRYSFEGNEKS